MLLMININKFSKYPTSKMLDIYFFVSIFAYNAWSA